MYEELKKAAEACKDLLPLRYMESPKGTLSIRNDYGIVFGVHQNRSFPKIMKSNKAHADFVLVANPSAVLALIAENERLAKQWGDRPAYRTPEYESKRDAMWRRAHMVATSKGYDHINMAIAAAPIACTDCMGCGGEWQGEGVPNAVCETCKGSRGKAMEAERDQLKAENARSTEREILQLAEIESLRKVIKDVWLTAPGQAGAGDISRLQRTYADVGRVVLAMSKDADQ